MSYYVPGTDEEDPKKVIMSLQQAHEKTATNTTDIATNTAAIAANTAAIAAISVPSAATQANQETATSTTVYVPPGRQQYHPSAAKAWVNFTGSGSNGAQTINASYNVTSVTRTAAGQYTVTFTTAFSSASYACIPSANNTVLNAVGFPTTLAAGTAAIQFVQLSPVALVDPANGAYVVFYGDQ